MLIVVGVFSGCTEINDADEKQFEFEMFYSSDNKTVLVYVSDDDPNLIVDEINDLMNEGFEFVGSYTTKLSWSQYANEAYLIFRLIEKG